VAQFLSAGPDRPHAKATPRRAVRPGGRGSAAFIVCTSCDQRRAMNEAQGEAGRDKLPVCRGHHPHLDAFSEGGCGARTRLMVVGASNLWFPVTQSIVVMPMSSAEQASERASRLRVVLGTQLAEFASQPNVIRALLVANRDPLADLDDVDLAEVIRLAVSPDRDARPAVTPAQWDPVDLLVPEWQHLTRPSAARTHDVSSGLTVTPRRRTWR